MIDSVFEYEWNNITKQLRDSGYDLSKIKIVMGCENTRSYITQRLMEDLEKEVKL